jgi:hypothetical protein
MPRTPGGAEEVISRRAKLGNCAAGSRPLTYPGFGTEFMTSCSTSAGSACCGVHNGSKMSDAITQRIVSPSTPACGQSGLR